MARRPRDLREASARLLLNHDETGLREDKNIFFYGLPVGDISFFFRMRKVAYRLLGFPKGGKYCFFGFANGGLQSAAVYLLL